MYKKLFAALVLIIISFGASAQAPNCYTPLFHNTRLVNSGDLVSQKMQVLSGWWKGIYQIGNTPVCMVIVVEEVLPGGASARVVYSGRTPSGGTRLLRTTGTVSSTSQDSFVLRHRLFDHTGRGDATMTYYVHSDGSAQVEFYAGSASGTTYPKASLARMGRQPVVQLPGPLGISNHQLVKTGLFVGDFEQQRSFAVIVDSVAEGKVRGRYLEGSYSGDERTLLPFEALVDAAGTFTFDNSNNTHANVRTVFTLSARADMFDAVAHPQYKRQQVAVLERSISSESRPQTGEALFSQGEGILRGQDAKKSTSETVRGIALIRQSAEAGHSSAQAMLASVYRNGQFGISADYKEALRWATAAVKGGNIGALLDLAVLYQDGLGIGHDFAQAGHLLERCVNIAPENSWCHLRLGRLYKEGLGVVLDLDRAKKHFETALAQGNPYAKDALRKLGEPVPKVAQGG